MKHGSYTTEEIVKRGLEMYETQIRERVEAENIGKFLVVDIETGDYVIDESDLRASKRAKSNRPNGIRFGLKIGYPASGTLGGAMPKSSQ